MSLSGRVDALATRIAAEIKALRNEDRSYVVPVSWWVLPQSVLQTAAAAPTSGQAGFLPIDLPSGTYDSLALNTSVAEVGGSTTHTLALYRTDPLTGFPDTASGGLMFSGTVSLITSTGTKTTTSVPTVLKAGRYWTCHLYVAATAPTTAASISCNGNNVERPPSSVWSTPSNYRGWARTGLTVLPTTAFTTANITASALANVAYIGVRRSA